jgi:hypothetical protein
MEQELFEKEISMCRELSKKNGGKCKWGECDKCGVIPLLYKIGKGEFYDSVDDIERIKNNSLK